MVGASYMLRRLCACIWPGRESPWGRAACNRHHLFIGLYDTGRTHPARFKRDAHLQGSIASGFSSCHAGLLAPRAGSQGGAPCGVVRPETRLHSLGVVVSVECSSRHWFRLMSEAFTSNFAGRHGSVESCSSAEKHLCHQGEIMTLTQRRCPYCDGKNVEQQRTYTIKSGTPRTMYHCAPCARSFS